MPLGVREELLQIGEVAARVGLSLRTIRYYEEVGLVTPAARSDGGFRLYSEKELRRLDVLKGVKPLGLSLEETRRLMEILDATEDPQSLAPTALNAAVADLEKLAAAAEARVAEREQFLDEARRLQRQIVDRLRECRRSAARSSPRSS